MAGLYFHIPYCRQACSYCNFHFSINTKSAGDMVKAMGIELKNRASSFRLPIETVYFGGGTPSLLDPDQIHTIFQTCAQFYDLSELSEITLEANPEDINDEKLLAWKSIGINRLSMGIQTLDENELLQFNRCHTRSQAQNAVELALSCGIHSINVDLIFGSPWLSDEQWNHNMDWAFSSGADHISAYALTKEPKTLLNKRIEKGIWPEVDDEKQSRQYKALFQKAEQHHWDFYEISNLSKPGHRAKHNSNYWKNKPYLGIGPSAHSYFENQRSWNVADNKKYIQSIAQEKSLAIFETLSEVDLFNEYILTNIRTVEGINLGHLLSFGLQTETELLTKLQKWVNSGMLTEIANQYMLTLEGRMMADGITSDLMAD